MEDGNGGGRGKRSYGSGSLFEQNGSWYAKWRIGGRQVKRRIGTMREPGSRDGLTRREAEARLRRLIEETTFVAPERRLTLGEAGERYLQHVEHVMERKRSTVQDYGIILRRHLAPYFGNVAIERFDADAIGGYMAAKAREGLATKTVSNHLNFLHGLFKHAVKRGWCPINPVAAVDRPRAAAVDPDIRFLDEAEVEALLRAIPDDLLGPLEHALYLTAAMTGLRQGELLALRWQDVDWPAGLIRVRRSFTRGEFGTPKSRRSSRAVPMADRVAGELHRHFARSEYQGDSDLVFCHPQSGRPYDPSKMRIRFKEALKRAGVRDARFHDLRHTFGTRMAAAGAPLRAIQEWMGHRNYSTTEIYADYAPDPTHGAVWAARAFGREDSGMHEPAAHGALAD